jgi:hypothetical protein
MKHFEAPHLNKRMAPQPGDTVWLVPIRYWEPEDYGPEQLDVKSVTEESLFGFHHGYGHDVYVSRHDAKWFFKEENAKAAQASLAIIEGLISDDDMAPIMKSILETKRGRKPSGMSSGPG